LSCPPWLAALLICAAPACITRGQSPENGQIPINTPYVATSPEIVDAMLDLAKVKNSDVVYDLGCGDGRIVISAAKEYGAHGVGIDINPQRISEANQNAERQHVANLVKF